MSCRRFSGLLVNTFASPFSSGARPTALSASDVSSALRDLPHWRLSSHNGADAISRSFKFADFSGAMAFITRCALAAESADHHPTWTNTFNAVDVVLTTHDAAGVSQRDIAMAKRMETFV